LSSPQAPNPDGRIEEGKKVAKKNIDLELHGLWGKGKPSLLEPEIYTASGWPAVSSTALRSLSGKPGAAKKALKEMLDGDQSSCSEDGGLALQEDRQPSRVLGARQLARALQVLGEGGQTVIGRPAGLLQLLCWQGGHLECRRCGASTSCAVAVPSFVRHGSMRSATCPAIAMARRHRGLAVARGAEPGLKDKGAPKP
jgi:hypothetical protein